MLIIFNNQQFSSPLEIIKCFHLSKVKDCFAKMEKALASGHHLAGFLSYEAGYAFEKTFADNKTYDFPLVCFGVFKNPHPLPPLHFSTPSMISPLIRGRCPSEARTEGVSYYKALKKIKKLLAAGDTYQVNYTFKQKYFFNGDPFSLFTNLLTNQPTPCSAFVQTDDFSILSLSPELFFKKAKDKIIVKPMKGTFLPGKEIVDNKNRSENLMIVDLLRNDLGRIAKTGTVKVNKLFEIEKHPTLSQMTSTIEAKTRKDLSLYELFKNLFPSGSVTGAPKVRTMQIIRELEKEPRRIYCGTIGYITPQRDMLFNVAIRTLLIRSSHSKLRTPNSELGIGSGVTYASDPKKEYEECLLKSKFLRGA
ncbi:MAG: chorismate-binding protein [bacterium]